MQGSIRGFSEARRLPRRRHVSFNQEGVRSSHPASVSVVPLSPLLAALLLCLAGCVPARISGVRLFLSDVVI